LETVKKLLWLLPLLATPMLAISPLEVSRAARDYRRGHEREIVAELMELIAIPNLVSDTSNIEKNANALSAMLTRRGAETRLLRVEGAPPLVYATMPARGAKTTVAFYAHYDGQPVDPSQWTTPPWQPVLRNPAGNAIEPAAHIDPESRIYGRSASDDKAPIIAMLAALDALKAAKTFPSVNLKFVFEGEEEAGSPHLASYFDRYPSELTADAWILCDGPVNQSRHMQLYFGARGITDLEITVYGPMRPLHSGHYGNWAPNPVVTLTHLIDSMRDTEGKILIAGFYDDITPLTGVERDALAAIPNIDSDLKRDLALGRTEGDGKPLNELILMPALNLRGILAGHVGEQASNTISTDARASIDFRLVPAQTPEKVRERVERHIASHDFFIVHDTPDAATRMAHPNVVKLVWGPGYPPARTSMDLPISRRVASVITAAQGVPPYLMPSLGGSVPMYLFQRANTAVVGLPIVNHDNNQHAANENLRVQNLWDGIEIFAALFTNLR
jgi:acetylornithine deacetylase/succinyl-diaminopimelate desuccinylase-like protein